MDYIQNTALRRPRQLNWLAITVWSVYFSVYAAVVWRLLPY